MQETGNEDVKGLQIYDKNERLRYTLRFVGGKLHFTSYNSSGSVITDKDII